MFQSIYSFVEKHSLIPRKSTIVLGLSGGPDSMFLLHFLCHLRDQGIIKKVIAAHLDHGWRADSAKNVAFCQQAAQTCNVPFISAHLKDIETNLRYKGSQEELGRRVRRAFLEKTRKAHHADAIALGHHLQDQQETFFIRLIRGTSLTGLCAMWPKRGDYIRPLLETNKIDIVRYLDDHNIPYLIDPTNLSPEFLRNKIRNTVLPNMRDCDERFDANFLSTLNRLQDIEQYLSQHTNTIFQTMTKEENGTLSLDITKLLAQPMSMQYRLLMQWLCAAHVPFPAAQPFLDEIIRFLQQPESKEHAIHHAWKIIKKKNTARIISNA